MWQIEEDDGQILLCFMCIDFRDVQLLDYNAHGSSLWANDDCKGKDCDICSIGKHLLFGYKFLRIGSDENVKLVPKDSRISQQYLILKEIKIVKPSYKFPLFKDNYVINGRYLHWDYHTEEDRRCMIEAWKDAAFLLGTKGIIEQDELERGGYGYIVMSHEAREMQLWSLNNPGIFNVSKHQLHMVHNI
jgi:hypothetical protein